MKNIVIGLATAALLLLSSCEKYLDVNQNPNDATSASPALVLPGVLQGVATRATVDVNSDFCTWMGYWAQADGWSGWFDIKQYQITTNNWQTFFNTPYSWYLQDIAYIEKNSTSSQDANYRAIAKILKSFVYEFLVDAYGDVPYSEANVPGIVSPKYDDGKAIYTDLIAQLDTAIAIIANSPTANTPEGDYLFDGDMTSWQKFANTLKLKMMLRQAYVSGYTPNTTGMDAIGYLDADATFNPGYSSSNMQPYYSTYGWTVSGAVTNPRTQYCMNAYIEDVYNSLNDQRKFRTFAPALSNGIYHGKQFGNEGDGLTNPFNKDNGNLVGPGLVQKSVTDKNGALIMSAFESYFLQAEALDRGWITSAMTEKELYEAAVTANFATLGIEDSAAIYLAQDLPEVSYDNAPNKLDLILNQKYIAFCGFSGFEAWCEYRRSGIPDPKASDPDVSMLTYYPGVNPRQIPHILYYPQREFNLNPNVTAAVKKSYGKDQDAKYHFNNRIFWDVTPLTAK